MNKPVSAAIQPEILDLRHYSASSLRPVLEAESLVWSERLAWDYRSSTDLLLQYLDARILPGFVAVEGGRVTGYAFCVYEDRKAVIGDVFALPSTDHGPSPTDVEALLLEHLIELLKHSPGVERIESQLLLHAHDVHSAIFRRAGFEVYRRIFMDLDVPAYQPANQAAQRSVLQRNRLELRSWRDSDFTAAGSLIARAYEGHLDSIINDQYRSVAGSLRFLHNIIRFPGCGLFDPSSSRVVTDRSTGELVALLLCSRVRQDVGHITQICVAHSRRGLGLGTLLLDSAVQSLAKDGFQKLSLTVTENNERAVNLYTGMGFQEQHSFDAMVWTARQGRS